MNLLTALPGAEFALNGAAESNITIPTGDNWMHIAFVFDSGAGRIDMYFDGKYVDSTFGATGVPCGDGRSSTIGSWDEDGLGFMRRFHDGRIDELHIYDRTLDQDEVFELAQGIFRDGFESGDLSAW